MEVEKSLKIIRYPSHYKILDFEFDKCPKLINLLRAWDNASFKFSLNYFEYDTETKVLCIPRGFPSNYLLFVIKQAGYSVDYMQVDDYIPFKNIIISSDIKPRDNKQKDAIDFLTSRQKFVSREYIAQKMLCLKTGEGKTFCTIKAISSLKKCAIIFVDSNKLMNQWKDEFLKFTNLQEDEIYFISGSKSIEKLLNKKNKGLLAKNKIYIAMHQTIDSYSDDLSKIENLFKKLKIGIKVFDEAHVEFKNILKIDCAANTWLTLYLTATPGRSDVKEDKIFHLAYDEIPKYGLEEKYKDNYHYLYYVSYNSKPDERTILSCTTKRGFNNNSYSDYIMGQRFDYFIGILDYLIKTLLKFNQNKNGKIAVILYKNEHIEIIQKELLKIFPDKKIGIFTSLIKKHEEREKELDSDIILSTPQSFGKALNVKDLMYLIMTVPSSSKIITEQMIGRLRYIPDNKVFYFDLTDEGFKQCIQQRRSRKQFLDKKALFIKKINID